jgi:dTDP-4-dehydrorhamnose reductase
MDRRQLDLTSAASIAAALTRHEPWAVINAAGWVRVEDAEVRSAECMLVNAVGATDLATACHTRAIATLNFSSDLVFGGRPAPAYCESDEPAPLNVYGKSKLAMERGVVDLGGAQLIIRTAAFFSPYDTHNFAVAVQRALGRGEQLAAAADYVISPTYVPDLCEAALDLLLDGESGIWHLTNGAALSWADFALRIAEACHLNTCLLKPTATREMGWKAPRPASSALFSERGSFMPTLDSAIERFASQCRR